MFYLAAAIAGFIPGVLVGLKLASIAVLSMVEEGSLKAVPKSEQVPFDAAP